MTSENGIQGKWYNQHGSEIDLTIDEHGRIRGSFRSSVGFPDAKETFDVVGVSNGDLIAFVVSFGKYDSVTSWAGHVARLDGMQTLDCLWHMSVGLPPGSEQQLWRGIWSGADTFHRERRPRTSESRSKPSHPVREYEFPVEDQR
jgi:hypothetical protein